MMGFIKIEISADIYLYFSINAMILGRIFGDLWRILARIFGWAVARIFGTKK